MDLKSMNSLHLPRQTEHSKLDIVYTFIVILYYIVPIFSARCRKTRAHSLSFFSLSLLHSCKNDLHIPIFTIALIRNRISVQKIVISQVLCVLCYFEIETKKVWLQPATIFQHFQEKIETFKKANSGLKMKYVVLVHTKKTMEHQTRNTLQ